jgi:hypothetical protein
MIDALLFATRDVLYESGLGYDQRTCDIRDDGKPTPRCGKIYLAIYAGPTRSQMKNALDEYYSFRLMLTQRVNVPLDRIGDAELASKTARDTGFNKRAHLVKILCHQNWQILFLANNYLVDLFPDADILYGFAEAAQFTGMDVPVLVGGEHFSASDSKDVGLKAEMRFDGARRLQPIGAYT